MTVAPGDRVPSVNLKELDATGALQDVSTEKLFAGRRAVVFGLPGAFTRTCSSRHLPGFVAHAAALKAKGINEIVCVSVNDAFVMDAWGKIHGAPGHVRMIGDGNAELVRALGLDKDATANGMGTRSQRFALLIEDGVVKHLAIDPPGKFSDTSAEAMLAAAG